MSLLKHSQEYCYEWFCLFVFSSVPSVHKKKKVSKQQNLDGMLRKFHKEKLKEFQLFNRKRMESHPAANHDSSDQAKSISADPLMTLVGADDLHQAVMEQDGLLTNDQNQENRGTRVELFQASLPGGLPPTLEQSLQELTRVLLLKMYCNFK